MPLFVGREKEIAEFDQLLRKRQASLVVCQGRRRIGKSTFIRRCAQKSADHFLVFEGLAPREGLGKRDQLAAFSEGLRQQTALPKLTLESWPQAFQLLATVLPASGRTVVLLDEISWLAIGDPDFAGHLKSAWDNHFSHHPGLILVLCGSVSSWIEQNVLNSAGFVGRCSWHFHLEPLPLPDCNRFWLAGRRRVGAAERLRVLAVTGGVPRYLEEIDPAQTAEQNVQRLCFHRGGLLFHEFDQIFHDVFHRRASTYRAIVQTLVGGSRTVSEIGARLGQERGGGLSRALVELEMAGFLRKDVSFAPGTGQDRPRTIRYRLGDNYLRFYLKYVDPVRARIEKGLYQMAPLESLHAWDTIMGLQFENLILSNLEALLRQTRLDRLLVFNAGPYQQKQTRHQPGCQIDLLLRSKHSLYLFEIKFRKRIDPSVTAEVEEKVRRLKLPRSTSVRLGLIYQWDLAEEIRHSDYFDFLVPFSALLGEAEP